MSHTATLVALRPELEAVRSGQAASAAMVRSLRAAYGLGAALKARHALDEILNRMESGSLFSEERCSFSRGDLHDALAHWLAHAATYLIRIEQTA